ncbi:MAG: neutral zinc metallopeptidase [Actinomycetes bacterium]
MDFEDDVQLDPTQVQDVRGQSTGASGGLGGDLGGALGGLLGGGSGSGLQLPGGGAAVGGGLVGLVIMVVLGLLAAGGGGSSTGSAQVLRDVFPSTTAPTQVNGSGAAAECRTGADADRRADCRIVGVVNSVQAYWDGWFASNGQAYQPARTQIFSGRTQSKCGPASEATGPFYCPADRGVYMDLSFFERLSEPPFNANGGPFAQAYVTAHEYGHHVSTLLGFSAGGDRQGATSGSVRLELQADCFAGVWAKNAVGTGFLRDVSDRDINEGLAAAAAVGDDRIQASTQGRARPETYTHGTSAQRQKWFQRGFDAGDPAVCDTFSGGI